MSELIKKHIDAFEQSGDQHDYDKTIQELATILKSLSEKMDEILKTTKKLRDKTELLRNISNETH